MLPNGTSSRVAGLTLASRRAARAGQLLAPSAAVLRCSRYRQCRAFCLGAWRRGGVGDADGDAAATHHAHRRLRAHKHPCMELSNRKLSRDNKARHHHVRAVIKTACAHIAANGSTSTAASEYINIKDVKSWSDELAGGLRPGRNIEDVEREAIDHLFNTRKQQQQHGCRQSAHRSPRDNIRKYLKGNKPQPVTADADVLRSTTSAQDGSGASSRASDPLAAKGSETKGCTPVNSDDPDAPRQVDAQEASKNYADLDKYKPVEWNEPDGLPELTPEEQSKQYQDLAEYASPNTLDHVTPIDSSGPAYNDLEKYKPVEWNEPDGLREQTPEELSKNYDDVHKYGPVRWNEPDGLPAPTPEELSKNYNDLDKYGPVKWSEPDGLRKLTPEELSRQYDDLDTYSKPFVAPDALLEAHEAAQQDATPKAEPIGAKVVEEDVLAADPAKDYHDLDKYGPVRWNEPDGLRKPTPEELSKNYQDLHLYSQYPNSGPATPRIHPEEASKQYDDLPKYDAFPNAGPAEERIHPEVASKQYDDLDKYPSAGYEEPDKTSHVHPEELTKNYQDLAKYQTCTLDSFDSKYPVHPEEASKAYDDLDAYKPVMHNEPDGKPVVEVSGMSSTEAVDNLTEPPTAAEIRRDVLQRAFPNSHRTMVQNAKCQDEQRLGSGPSSGSGSGSRQSTSPEGADSATSSRPVMTGNYARDFPEEFAASWSTSNSWSKSTLFPSNLAGEAQPSKASSALGWEKEEADFSSMDESFPSETANEALRLQPALDRQSGISGRKPLLSGAVMERSEKTRLADDAYSKSPQGLELSYLDDGAGRTAWPRFVRHYKNGRQNKERNETSASGMDSPSEEQQPVSYKMLAYDASTQTMSVAETWSGAPNTSTRATPADVLLRVSNPAKFFPYFSALQAEGYEIASGSGDVLVFRKVRPGTASKDASGPGINPIDMMGRRSGASNLASPTGHVSCESAQYRPADAGEAQETKARSKKRSLGRKVVVGTAWVAGTAYAVSVAGEYLSTGGKAL
ncbi:hypothetical protein E4U53_000589 [Claviceps sorghi]|nr:hypothetical protein E4U53_000589 [Claviceps sorghi]